MATGKRSQGVFPTTASHDDDAGILTTSYGLPVGVGSAKTFQFNIVADFAADTDEVIVQVQKNGQTKNLTFTWADAKLDKPGTFTAGTYRIAAYHRGHGITGLRIGLSSTATNVRVDCSAVC